MNMNNETKTCTAKREGSKIRVIAFIECAPNKPGAHLEREIDSGLPKDTIAFRVVLENPGDGALRSVGHLEPNVPTEVVRVRITDESGQKILVPIGQGDACA